MNKHNLIFIVKWFLITFVSIVILSDTISFFNCATGEYTTPWFDNRWYKEPVTHLNLLMYPETYYFSTNGAGQTVLEREVSVGKIKFWTIVWKKTQP